MRNGIYVTPTDYVQFGESRKSLAEQIATRSRSIDFSGLGLYLPNPDPVLKKLGKDIRVYRELRGDALVGGNIRRRKAAVKAMEWGLDRDQAKGRVAKVIESVFADLDMERIITEMLDAALYGYQPMEVIWGKVGPYIVPVDIVGKPPEWFLYSPENELRFRSRDNMMQGEELPPNKFLVPRQDASYDNPYGFADLSMCFWPVTFKRGGLKFWVSFTEKYGMPWVIGKHPRGASPRETDELLGSLEAMVQDAVGVIPDDASVDIKEAAGKTGSAEVYERLLMYCRSEINVALLGQNQTTEASANKASATAGLEVTRDIRDGDAALVAGALNKLIRWICELNFSGAARPQYSLWEQEEVDKTLAERDETLTKAGAKFTNAYFERSYGLQKGDLMAAQALPEGGAELPPAAEFAESDPALFPDQIALDEAIDSLAPAQLQAQMAALLKPVFQAVKAGAEDAEVLGLLAEAYPQMDGAALEQTLTRLLFAAEVWGRLSAQAEREAS